MESNTAAALRDMVAASAMPPPPTRRQQQLKNLRITQNNEESSDSYDNHDKKRRKSSIAPSTATGELRPIMNRPRSRKENAGVRGRPEGRGGRGHRVEGGPLCHKDTRRGLVGARHGNLAAESKSRHFPPIGSFKPPPPPTRAPLAHIRNQNKQQVSDNTRTQNAHLTKDKHKNAIKSTVTYVENHKGELEIIKYKNRKRGSVVAFDEDLEVHDEVAYQRGHQHQEQLQQLPIEGHAEQDDNQYHQLRRVVSKNKRNYAKELYHLFKHDLRDWEEQQELIRITGALRDNISINPRLLTMENPYHDMDKMENIYFSGKPPKASVLPRTPQQLTRQREATELQYGQNNVSPRDVIMRGEDGGLMSRYDPNASNGANNYIIGNNGFTGCCTGAPIGAPIGVACNNNAVGHNGNNTYYNNAPYEVASMPQQHQHGDGNFVQVINDEEHRRNVAANITQQQPQQQIEQTAWVAGARIGAMGSAPIMGAHNSYMISRHGLQDDQGYTNMNKQTNAYLTAGNHQTPVIGQPAFFGQYGQDGPQQVVQQQPLMHASGGITPPFLEDELTSYDPFADKPPQQRASFAQYNSPEQMRSSFNAFATFDQDQDAQTMEARHPFSPYRGPVSYGDVPLSPLTFQVQVPEHTFRAQSAFQQTYAQNGQPYYGGGAGPLQYVPGTGFLYDGKVPDIPGPVYQMHPGNMGFLHTYHTNPVIREGLEQMMVAHHGLRPTPQQMMPQAIPMPLSMPPPMLMPTGFQQQQMYDGPGQMPMPPPMPMRIGFQGFQQQHMYGGTGQMPAHDQFNTNISNGGHKEGSPIHVPYPSHPVNNYDVGGNNSGQQMSEEPRIKKSFSCNSESPEFSATQMPMYNGKPEQPQKYTRQEVIVPRDSPDTFFAKQPRCRHSFESPLYNEYLATEVFEMEKEVFDRSQIETDNSTKSVADSYPDPASPRSSYDRQRGLTINSLTLSKEKRATALAKLNQGIQRTSGGRGKGLAADHDWSFLEEGDDDAMKDLADGGDYGEAILASSTRPRSPETAPRQQGMLASASSQRRSSVVVAVRASSQR